MSSFLIEDNILKAYFGNAPVVVVPDGVVQIGGDLRDEPKDYPRKLRGDPIGYKAFFENRNLEELYLPDSVREIGFKALEHCAALRILSFSSKMQILGCNALVGCTSLKTIIYRGTIYEFSCLSFPGQALDLDVVYCTDGKIQLGKDREYYIETLYFPGTKAEWENKYGSADWRNRRSKNIVFLGDAQSEEDRIVYSTNLSERK
jgi:hypothetical protein